MEKTAFSAATVTDPTVKKLYRACVECVKLLDQSMKGKTDAHALSELTPIRNRLRECCEKLLFMNPLEFGRKADEILWRKCHYEPIKILRQHNLVLSNESKCFLNTMLTAAIGYYQLLSLKLQQAFPDDCSVKTDFQRPSLSPIVKKEKEKPKEAENSQKLQEWSISERHRILIYQGDLARYLYETDGTVDMRMAQHYYHQALVLKPFHGTPHNQLGTLFLTTNHGLDAAYYYLRSISSEENFSGAEENLLTLLKKNEQALQQFLANNDGQEPVLDGSPDTDFKYFVLAFLSTAQVLYLDEPQNNDNGVVQQVCGRTIRSFYNILQHLVTKDSQLSEKSVCAFDSELVVKIFVAQMILIAKLQEKSSLKLSPAVALFLSMFANFLNHIVNDFCNDLVKHRGGVIDAPVAKSSKVVDDSGPVVKTESDFVVEHAAASRKPNLRRRRRGEEDDEDEDVESDTSSESSIRSENELNGDNSGLLSTSDSDDIIELSDEEDLSLAKLVAQNGMASAPSNVDDSAVGSKVSESSESSQDGNARRPWIELSPAEKIEVLASYGVLVPLKIICDWFRCNQNFLVMVQQNASELWSSFARILNFLPDDRHLASYMETNRQISLDLIEPPSSSLNDWVQKYPLPEDVMLRGVRSISQIHGKLDYKTVVCGSLESEAVLRICCLRAFGHHLINLNTPCFRFDRARMEFITSNGQTIIQDSTESDKKNALMRSMAQLRLKGELASAEQLAWIPVYLVPDALALCHKLPSVKKLASAQKFILVIPTATINELDRMKKDSGLARSATRWLESQFRHGNKFVRVQKTNERDDSLAVDEDESTGKLPGNFMEMLQCASQLRKAVKAGTTGGSTVVTILTNHAKNSTEYEEMEKVLRAATLPGVTLANLGHFCHKWDSYRKKGS